MITGARRRRKPIRFARSLLLELFFLLLSLLIIVPLALMILGSFKSSPEAAKLNLDWPRTWVDENYQVVFERGKVGRAMINSIVITVSAVLGVVLVSGMAAFYLIRRRTKLNHFLIQLFYLGLVAPLSIITTVQLLQWLQLYGSYAGVICIFVALHMPFSVFLISGFVKTVPRELDEAAEMDGCGPLRLFFRIVLPLLVPVFVTCAIINFMGIWNDFTVPLFFLTHSSKWTMPLTVYNFFGQYSSDWNLVFADLILTAAPVLVVFLLAQRFIIEGMTTGAVKG